MKRLTAGTYRCRLLGTHCRGTSLDKRILPFRMHDKTPLELITANVLFGFTRQRRWAKEYKARNISTLLLSVPTKPVRESFQSGIFGMMYSELTFSNEYYCFVIWPLKSVSKWSHTFNETFWICWISSLPYLATDLG